MKYSCPSLLWPFDPTCGLQLTEHNWKTKGLTKTSFLDHRVRQRRQRVDFDGWTETLAQGL